MTYSRPNVYEALADFIKELFPDLEVRRGDQNAEPLPNEYALVWEHFSNRRGTNIRSWALEDGKDVLSESESRTVYCEIDFVGENALEQSEAFEAAFGSVRATVTLGEFGVFPHYIDVRDDADRESDQNALRYRVYAYVGITGTLKREIETFSVIEVHTKVV
jgi:hypothetical protein